ncbi:hypothetical protein [Sulfurospirillum sp. 1612]|uniref:hypothetical protein n=1 Tax=Sulfurospirillum sp. 1612 TaxID=3094835 RepID=UPI002F91ED59
MSNEEDKYEEELDKALQAVKACQEKLQLDSCMQCDKIFECTLRKTYVDAVYNSMSKGQSGGFEF